MVIFNDLRLTDEKDKIVVDCFIEGLFIYANMYIKSIYVEYYKNALLSGDPSDKAIQIYSNTDTSVQAVRVCLSNTDTQVKENFGIESFDDGLYYIIVDCDGELSSDTSTYPCGYDETRDTGVVLDWQRIYEIGMSYITQYNNSCFNPCQSLDGFDNFIIAWNSLRLAISICDFSLLKKVYEKILRFAGNADVVSVSSCGCNK